MNKSILMKFAIESRNTLMKSIDTTLMAMGFTASTIPASRQSGDKVFVNEKEYSKVQYDDLVARYKELGYEQLKESMAYTWFNRFVALRFMEANEYINEKIITSSTSKIEPDLVSSFRDASFYDNLSSTEKDYLLQLKDADNVETLYAKLVIYKCNELNKTLPFMFEKMGDYTELLFPSNLITKGSFLESLREAIYKEGEEPIDVEIIGWLYQYYNSQFKDEVFSDLKKNKKLTKDTIPAATQLFTPKWIVKYMVENSLGNLLLESTEGQNYEKLLELKKDWKYYIDQEITKSEILSLEEIKLIDPCMGSGHILVYVFDFLYKVYEAFGYDERAIIRNILEKNLYGLEIDDRATQLAQFALMMKAREKYKRLLRILENDPIRLNIYAIQESKENVIDGFTRQTIGGNGLVTLNYLADKFHDAKELGSILTIKDFNLEKALTELETLKVKLGINASQNVLDRLEALVYQADNLARKYDVVVTNPPYMGSKSFSSILLKFVDENYKPVKRDLFSVFMQKSLEMTKEKKYTSLITPESWMFLVSGDLIRKKILEETTICTLLHLGDNFFNVGFGVASYTLKKGKNDLYRGIFFDLRKADQEEKENEFFEIEPNKIEQKYFFKLKGFQIAYWMSHKILNIFENNVLVESVASPRQGMTTSDNNRFLRFWEEVNYSKIEYNCNDISETSNLEGKWYPYNKGGAPKKWYGNNFYVVNWENDGYEMKLFHDILNKTNPGGRIKNKEYYFKEGITYSDISGLNFAGRYTKNSIFDVKGSSTFFDSDKLFYFLGFFNTNVIKKFIEIINPTITTQVGDLKRIPVVLEKEDCLIKTINEIVNQNIYVSKSEWDSRETSWDFKKSPLLDFNSSKNIENAIDTWFSHAKEQFVQMHKNEEELNKIFIDIYGLADEMNEKVEFKDITLYKDEFNLETLEDISLEGLSETDLYLANRKTKITLNTQEIIKQFISYGVGCIMGRYSLDKEGLVIANSDDELVINNEELVIKGEDGEIRHTIPNPAFVPDVDGIIPVVDTEYFPDDIVNRFVEFVETVFGSEYLDTNLSFIANALDKKDTEFSKDAIRRYFLDKFMDDHIKRYNKRPIYWMFQSDKKGKAFNCLVYLHRYHENTVGKIRQEYLLPYQARIQTKLSELTEELETSTSKGQLQKQIQILANKINEIKAYDENVKYFTEHKVNIDLDDGVAVNYKKLEKILYKEPKITKSKED